MNLSELVAQTIMTMLEESGGAADIQRNELAAEVGCAPSQINYVLTSRFTRERGYIVESRRGGGGYIRITRMRIDGPAAIMHMVNSIGAELDQRTARMLINDLAAGGIIPPQTARVIFSACTDGCYRDCPPEHRDKVRAAVFKQMIMSAI